MRIIRIRGNWSISAENGGSFSWKYSSSKPRIWIKNECRFADEANVRLFTKLIYDDRGGEVLEYALIAGLIVVAAIATIAAVGGKVLAYWSSANSSM
jgi:Flp pilus assembly pilin Flp